MRLRVIVVSALLAIVHFHARADHVLLSDGTVLFNVSLHDDISTAARPLRVRYGSQSYLFDHRRGRLDYRGDQISGQFRVADFVTTNSQVVGKRPMLAFMKQHGWTRYYEPPPPRIQMPTPEPIVTATPVPMATPLPVNVASTSFPLEQRLFMQRDMFMQELQTLARDIRTSMTAGALNEAQALQIRLEWLEAQKQVLDRFYPADSEPVREAKVQWDLIYNQVQGLGKFEFEP